ncbi:hypothetical protein Rhopal_003046-T1 [Rhodotorula paludigena]|uniref:Guanine nucleotide-binding protein alpha-2 subunit n=1 Tax=Rhodotorula paludigena TaxID=86838 RepID=A0AAV5GIL8_9BASI|nr:hypothetical protein Rhopal_003046-T1 [Rhodotorula paludigena]
MGACGSTEAAGADGTTAEEVQRSKVIDRMLREDEQRAAKEVKMLLLGPGASGKSTILKQMKLIHLSGFTPTEIESYRQQIFVNVREGMRMCFMILEDEGAELQDPSLIDYREPIESAYDLRDSEPFPVTLLQPLKALWADKGMQKVAAVASEAELPENIPYFFAQLDRLFDPAYVPTEQDILRIFDVGGQRSERKKWIHCFEGVTAIIFLASLAGYDQVLIEDRDSNQMQEALMLFDSICNSQWFVNTSMILFLNKLDVFKERIFVSHVKAHFPDYIGPELDAQAAQEFFKSRFTRLNRSARKEIYTHYTTAIDTNLVKVVMTSVYDIILKRNLQDFIL